MNRSSPAVLVLRLLWGVIPLGAAAAVVSGMNSPVIRSPIVVIGSGVGLLWLTITYFAARTRCRRCRRWFAGEVISRLPAFVKSHSRSQHDVTYRCKFCGHLSFERE